MDFVKNWQANKILVDKVKDDQEFDKACSEAVLASSWHSSCLAEIP